MKLLSWPVIAAVGRSEHLNWEKHSFRAAGCHCGFNAAINKSIGYCPRSVKYWRFGLVCQFIVRLGGFIY
jgi:hypothetical protein